jgi:glycosyltransferase involved in cell wall biosynthesis
MARLNFLYTHDNSMGYGRMGTQLAKQFSCQGVQVMDWMHRTDANVASHVLWAGHSYNAKGWFDGQHRSLLTMWETTRLPELIREGLHNVNTVFVPSEHNLEVFGKYHENVFYVPLGVDPETWHFRKRVAPRQSFRFLADGRGARKGTDVAVAAFHAAFPELDSMFPRPTLILKGNVHSKVKPQNGLQLMSQRISDEAEIALYGSAHVYLAPTRGEGWGLCPLQAICQGIPTILTDAHGHAAFAQLGWGLRSTLTRSDYELYGDGGEWWEPDFDQLVDTMRWMYENYDKARQMAELFSEEALTQFTWENTATDILGHLDITDDGWRPGSWVEPTYKTYPVVCWLPRQCQIGGIFYNFEVGKLTYERAEVKRILFESGSLDPSCLEMDDNGLTPEQGQRSASQGYCPTCLQELNSKPLSEAEAGRSHE